MTILSTFYPMLACATILLPPTILGAPFKSNDVALYTRAHPTLLNNTGTIHVLDPDTQKFIPQGDATDGSGNGFSLPAIIWICFSLSLGLPMALAGVRGWRATTGVTAGLTSSFCAWVALINAVNDQGISDILLTLVIMGFFSVGVAVGVWNLAHTGVIVSLGIIGGLAFGIRAVLLRSDGLLVQNENLYMVNWILPLSLGILGGLSTIWYKRQCILFSCTSVGTFLTFLGIDLIFNKQDGLSRGLRFLCDRNTNHLADILVNGYHPKLLTRIFIAVSLGIVPIIAVIQHKMFPQPFDRDLSFHQDLTSTYLDSEDKDRPFIPLDSGPAPHDPSKDSGFGNPHQRESGSSYGTSISQLKILASQSRFSRWSTT